MSCWSKGQASYTPEQEVALWKAVVRHAVSHAKRKYKRWSQEELTLNVVTDGGDEVSALISAESSEQAFDDVDLRLTIAVLPMRERIVIEGIYVYGQTQRELADEMGLSQSKVNQLHKGALKRLKGMITDEMHSTTDSRTYGTSSTR